MSLSRRRFLWIVSTGCAIGYAVSARAQTSSSMVIDDLSQDAPLASNGSRWQLFTDQVMGGVSRGTMLRETVAGRAAIRMRGDVSLENNGGFVQIALDLRPDGGVLDASGFAGIEIDVYGKNESYGLHLRTEDATRPWQSYRQTFVAHERWQTVRLPFAAFAAYRIEAPLDLRRLRRIGLVAIGRAFTADLSVGRVAFYRSGQSEPQPRDVTEERRGSGDAPLG